MGRVVEVFYVVLAVAAGVVAFAGRLMWRGHSAPPPPPSRPASRPDWVAGLVQPIGGRVTVTAAPEPDASAVWEFDHAR